MIRLFKHYISTAVAALAAVEFLLLLISAELGRVLRAWPMGTTAEPIIYHVPQTLSFAVVGYLAMAGVGMYQVEALTSGRVATGRLIVATSLSILFVAVLSFIYPELKLWRSTLLASMAVAFALILGLRVALRGRLLGSPVFRRRVLVLGAGPRAARLAEIATQPSANFTIVAYIAMNDSDIHVPEAVDRSAIDALVDRVRVEGITQVVLALEERRNALPLAELVRVKTLGVEVSDLSSFLERETGRVDLESVSPSWLIFSDGFSAGRRISSIAKRMFDLLVSLLLLLISAPLVILGALAVKLESPGPAFFRQQRVGRFGELFDVVKLRSMRQDAEAAGQKWAEKDDPRITRVGRFIRQVRIDELPQVWSVLKGDMSFVGPRPEIPKFVADLETKINYYAERHMVKPGITGWAQINYPYGASVEDARHKLEYDLYYVKNYSPFLDLLIILQTMRVLLWPEGVR